MNRGVFVGMSRHTNDKGALEISDGTIKILWVMKRVEKYKNCYNCKFASNEMNNVIGTVCRRLVRLDNNRK